MKLPEPVFEKRVGKITEPDPVELPFDKAGLYLIEVSASAQGEKQIGSTDDEDLVIQVNGQKFLHPGKTRNREKDSPAAFSGGQLHGATKTVFIFTYLKSSSNTVTLIPQGAPDVKNLKAYEVEAIDNLELELGLQAEEVDRKPWVAFTFFDLPLVDFSLTVTLSRRPSDSDDLQVRINGKIAKNLLARIWGSLWRFAWSILARTFKLPPKVITKTETFPANFKEGVNYIELWADERPILQKAAFNFGAPTKQSPLVEEPLWTGDFSDDSEQMILARAIFAEARGESRDAKIAVGWVVRNRIEDRQGRWPKTYHEVLLQKNQFEPFDPSKESFIWVTDPLHDLSQREAWLESYDVAGLVIEGKVEDKSESSNFFHGAGEDPEEFMRRDGVEFVKQISKTRFYKK